MGDTTIPPTTTATTTAFPVPTTEPKTIPTTTAPVEPVPAPAPTPEPAPKPKEEAPKNPWHFTVALAASTGLTSRGRDSAEVTAGATKKLGILELSITGTGGAARAGMPLAMSASTTSTDGKTQATATVDEASNRRFYGLAGGTVAIMVPLSTDKDSKAAIGPFVTASAGGGADKYQFSYQLSTVKDGETLVSGTGSSSKVTGVGIVAAEAGLKVRSSAGFTAKLALREGSDVIGGDGTKKFLPSVALGAGFDW